MLVTQHFIPTCCCLSVVTLLVFMESDLSLQVIKLALWVFVMLCFMWTLKKKLATRVCVKSTLSNSALCFPLTVVLQCFSSLSHLPPHPPGWLAAVRQNWIHTSTTTSEHVHTLIHTHTQCHRLCYYCSKMVLQPCYGVNVVGYDGPQPQCTHISAHILSSAMED